MQNRRQRILYVLADFLSAGVGWTLFNVIRYYTLPVNYSAMTISQYFRMPTVILGQVLFPLMMVLLFAISGYYNKVFFKSRLNDVLNAMGISLIGAVIIFFTALFNDYIDDRLSNVEMTLIVWGLIGGITAAVRVLITQQATRRIWRRHIVFNTIIVGNANRVASLAHNLEEKYRNMGFRVTAFVTPNGEKVDIPGIPTYSMQQIEQATDETKAASFIIVPEGMGVEQAISVINNLLPTGKSVYITPDAYHYITSRPRTSMVAGEVLIDVSRADIPESTLNLKRIGDVAVSAVALMALLPVFAVVAILIKRDSPGPVIYSQQRIGYKKKPFCIYKFRSMYTDAEAAGPALASDDDPRITRVGRFLRKYRIDELPQFWNVLVGDMSLVGPRPEREYYLKQIIARAPHYNLVHQVRPGITSWGMVKYGYAQNIDQMLQRMKYDLLYVENVSFTVDLKILFYTVSTVLTGKGI